MGNIKLYRLQKRHNSTLQPTGTATDTSVVLKGGTDIISPTFTMHHNTFPTYNYVKYNGRYYFVNKIVAVRDDLFDMECEIDVLATYKESIKATSAYVLYYTHTNTEISDTRLSLKTTTTYDSNQGTFDGLGTYDPNNLSIVLMVNGVNTVCAYAVHPDDIGLMLLNININMIVDRTAIDWPYVKGGVDWMDKAGRFIDCWADWLVSLFSQLIYSGKAIDNIRSAHILPLSLADIGGNTHRVNLGSFDTGVDARKITDQLFTDHATVTIPWQGKTDWRRLSPYMEMYLYIPYIGVISLSTSDLIGETTLTVYMSLDKFSGDAIFQVKTGNGKVIGHYSTNLRSEFPIGASNVSGAKSTGSMVSSAVGAATAVAGIATGGPGAVIVGGAASAALGLVNMVSPTDTSIGGSSGGAVMGLTADKAKITCFSIFHDTTVNPHDQSAIVGEPYNGVMSLNISGYVQTSGASVAEAVGDPVMVDYERNLINDMLDGGVYIE